MTLIQGPFTGCPKSSVVDPDPVGSALFGRIRIRTVMEKTDPGFIKTSQNKGDKKVVDYNFIRFITNLFKKRKYKLGKRNRGNKTHRNRSSRAGSGSGSAST